MREEKIDKQFYSMNSKFSFGRVVFEKTRKIQIWVKYSTQIFSNAVVSKGVRQKEIRRLCCHTDEQEFFLLTSFLKIKFSKTKKKFESV